MTRFSLPPRAVLMAAFLVMAGASALPGQTKLRWQFQKGEVLNQSVVQDMKMAMQFGEQDVTTNMTQTIDARWTIDEVDAEGTASITQQFHRIRMKMNAAGGVGFDFDSDDDGELTGVGAVLAPALKALAKAEFKVKMTAQGQILEAQVSDETVDAFKSLPGAGQMGGMFSKEGLVNMIKQGSHSFPEESIQKGASWTTKAVTELPQVGKMEAVSTLTYAGPEKVDGKKLERVDIAVATSLVPKEGGTAQVTVKDQDAKGSFYFDNAAGRLSRSKLQQKMTLQVAVGGNNIDQKIDQTIEVRITPAAQ